MKPYHFALIVAGIDEEYQNSVLSGIISCVQKYQINLSCFHAFGGVLASSKYDIGEYNIYNLVNFHKIDAVIFMNNTIGNKDVRDTVAAHIRQAGVPTIVLDNTDSDTFLNLRIDNQKAMHDVIEHVITEHGAKTVEFISGPPANPEAMIRYQAFLNVMQAHDLPVDERRVHFGEFRPKDGADAAEAMLSSGLPLPDALISANDAMALEAISVLDRNGIRVPEDILVTGFDDTYNAKHHSPALTSVSRPLFEAGALACETLYNLLEGRQPGNLTLNATAVFRASCGCFSDEATGNASYQRYKKKTYELMRRNRNGISLLNRMTAKMETAETAAEMTKVVGQFAGELECEQCALCLCTNWQSAFHSAEMGMEKQEMQIEGYTEYMTAPVIWKNGVLSQCDRFPSADMFPLAPEGGGNVSYFLPLHFRERCLGYYVITNSDFPTKSMHCHSLMMNISHSFENLRKLLHLNNAIKELDRLYVLDPLCNIYNRNGFVRLADQMFRHCMKEKTKLLIGFIDMDGLKYVNDNFGHDEGDFALAQLAQVISKSCRKDQICARFGGDEFIIAGADAADGDGHLLEEAFKQQLAETNAIIQKPYELQASIGTFVTEITPDMKLFPLIGQADQIMYEQKKRKKTSRYLRKD